MRRPLWVTYPFGAALAAGLAVPALSHPAASQDVPAAGADASLPAVEPAAETAAPTLDPAAPDAAPLIPPVDPPASALPPGTPAVDPAAPAVGNQVPTVDPAEDPSVDSAVPDVVPGVVPARPRGRIPAGRGVNVAPPTPGVVPSSPETARRAAMPATPGADIDDADGQGAPLVPQEEAAPAYPGRPIINSLGPDAVTPSDAMPADGLPRSDGLAPADDLLPPAGRLPADSARPVAPGADPGYAAPLRTRRPARADVPRVSLDEVVRNPIRVYDARLRAMTGDWHGATLATDTLLQRFPNDPRVPYLRYFVFARSGQRDLALDALRDAIALEETYPVGDYGRFLEPFQGPDRFYLEQVRRAAGELDSVGSLTIDAPAAAVPPQPVAP